MKVALYVRVSKDDVGERFQSPENQIAALKKKCQFEGWTIVETYIDKVSGAKANRPAFRQMMKDAHQQKFRAILVWKLDRFSREPMFMIMGYINDLKRFKVGLISITEAWLDTRDSNPTSELLLAIMAWFCSEERRKISERTKAGIARKRAEGTYKGGRPVGAKDSKPRKIRYYKPFYKDVSL